MRHVLWCKGVYRELESVNILSPGAYFCAWILCGNGYIHVTLYNPLCWDSEGMAPVLSIEADTAFSIGESSYLLQILPEWQAAQEICYESQDEEIIDHVEMQACSDTDSVTTVSISDSDSVPTSSSDSDICHTKARFWSKISDEPFDSRKYWKEFVDMYHSYMTRHWSRPVNCPEQIKLGYMALHLMWEKIEEEGRDAVNLQTHLEALGDWVPYGVSRQLAQDPVGMVMQTFWAVVNC